MSSAYILTSWRMSHNSSQSESYITADGQSTGLSWNKAPIWGLRPDIYLHQTAEGLLMWSTLSVERTGLSFATAAGPRQRSHSRVRVPMEVFDPASTRDSHNWLNPSRLELSARTTQKTPLLTIAVQSSWEHVCLRSRYSATAAVYLLIPRSLPSSGRCS
jgi:hypothetical protein